MSLPRRLCSLFGRLVSCRWRRGRFLDLFRGGFCRCEMFRDLFDVPLAELVTGVFSISVAFEGSQNAA